MELRMLHFSYNARAQRYINDALWSNGRKNNVSYCYRDWCESKGFTYIPKKYRVTQTLPYIPPEKELDQLIGGFDIHYCPEVFPELWCVPMVVYVHE